MSAIKSWKDLLVWQKSHALTLDIFKMVRAFPPDEKYRVTDQLCRAVSSIPTNIAEGKGRGTMAEYRQFLIIARGSLEETRYLCLLAKDLGYMPSTAHQDIESRSEEISRMLNALIAKLCP